VPLVFVEGEPAKMQRIRTLLPDAVYTTWNRIRSSLRTALAKPPTDPVVPASSLAGYSGTPLPKKLGIKPGSIVSLVGAPNTFAEMVEPLPDRATLKRNARGARDLTIWFVTSQKTLERRMAPMAVAGANGLWIAWPKKTSGATSDLTQAAVRKAGLAAGLVDYKICAIDETWSALKFTRRK
jgi:hypothetical protein